jgi:hypothetical protein
MSRVKMSIGAAVLAAAAVGAAPAAGADAKQTIAKALKALGGEEKLAKVKAFTIKTKGTVSFAGNDREVTSTQVAQGLDHFRREAQFGEVNMVYVIAGDKGWRKRNDRSAELQGEELAREKRTTYLLVLPITLVAVRGDGFTCTAADEQKVGDKPAVGVKVNAPDGKDFTLYFDKESGLPVKMVAKFDTPQSGEISVETIYSDYKDFDGIKKATKITSTIDGKPFQNLEVTEFKVLDKVEADTFTEPK